MRFERNVTKRNVTTRCIAILVGLATTIAFAGSCRAPTLTPDDIVRVQRAALTALFLHREHAQQLTLWRGTRRHAPTLGELSENAAIADSVPLLLPDTVQLRLPIAVHTVDLVMLEQFFQSHPTGWDAWYAKYPGSNGVIELTAPTLRAGSGNQATVLIARTCGDHCRSVWRLTAQRAPDGEWNITVITALPLPKL